ncbi:acylpyruvase FAHD1: mitochondrial-like isoform X2 [Dinothrombium tinctorium]|uniref:Oxaloacetate tautomerase FAHD1, mitochondrial n=1 Tax=Dinothrombium tinctorium TaxID=1965070 RepID=A0A3S3NVF8_9ACAR|nr:acylpyruvase FAHD1: mitochondrial-like isoform X2 [Dinothrombium tinctorium]
MRLVKFVEFSRKIVAVGKNYAAHIKEMGSEVPSKPVFFLKPATAYVTEGNPIKIPKGCTELHHEVELGVIIGRKACDVEEKDAMDYVGGYTVALDMTARDWQLDAKSAGLPWSLAKGFDTSCPVGQFIPKEQISDINSLPLWCKVNGQMRQNGNTKDMILKVPFIVSYASNFFTLEPGDLVLTGTPSGVGQVKAGDCIEAGLGDIVKIKFDVVNKEK